MSDSASSTLRRMAGADPAGKGGDAADGSGNASAAPPLERAIRKALQRLADGAEGLGLVTRTCTTRLVDGVEAFDGLDPSALCLLTDPPGLHFEAEPDREALAAASGAISLSPAVTDALIEVQTVGRLVGPSGTPRRPTRIDAALVQPFARDLLAQTSALVPPLDEITPRPGKLRAGRYVAGPGPLPTLLTSERFLRLDLSVGMGSERTGEISIFLPQRTVAVLDAPLGSEPDPEWIAAVETAMAEAPVRMDAVLTGLTLPLSELLALEVGQVLPLPDKALTSVVLRGRSGRDAGRRKPSRPPTLTGRLGQFHGQRAVKVADVAGIPLPVGRTTSPPALEGLSTDAVAAAAHPALMAGVADGATAAAMGDDLRGLGAEGDAGLSGLSDDDDLSDLANLPALPDLP